MKFIRIPYFCQIICLSLTGSASAQTMRAGDQRAKPVVSIIDTLQVEARHSGAGPDHKGFSEWKNYSTLTISQLPSDPHLKETINTDKYGSRMDHRAKPTGFFHTEKINGRWSVIDPEGYLFICKAVNSINTGKTQLGDHTPGNEYQSQQQWISAAAALIKGAGFNTAGAWSDVGAVISYNKNNAHPLAYTVMLNWMSGYGQERGGTYSQPGHTGYPNNTIFVFDPEFERYCQKSAEQLTKYRDDPNCFGYFSDNEMPMNTKNLEGYLSLSNKKDPGYIAAKKWIDEHGIRESAITDQNKADFLAYVAETYYSIVATAIRKYDANHMYIGSRLYAGEKNVPEFFKAAGKYLDIVSINHYHVWSPVPSTVDQWANWSGKPFMITEYYAKGMDAPGLANTTGAGWVVKTQADRGRFYQNFCMDLLRSKNCVGWHWFKYRDNDPSDKTADASNNDSNKGMVNIKFESYAPLIQAMKSLNDRVYQLTDYYDAGEK